MSAAFSSNAGGVSAGAGSANTWRGEAELVLGGVAHKLRPSFGALVAAEAELGPLLALVDRAAAGELRLGEITSLFWHCLETRGAMAREDLGEALVAGGIAPALAPLKALIGQILQGGR